MPEDRIDIKEKAYSLFSLAVAICETPSAFPTDIPS
jgi:hypothetical protein